MQTRLFLGRPREFFLERLRTEQYFLLRLALGRVWLDWQESFRGVQAYFCSMTSEDVISAIWGAPKGSVEPQVPLTAEKALYVGNIGRAPQRDIERLVESFGKVRRVEMKTNYCFVYFDEAVAAVAGERAISSLHGQSFGPQARTLTVEWARGTAPRSVSRTSISDGASGIEGAVSDGAAEGTEQLRLPSKTLFVVNFDPDEITSRDLLIHFHRFGPVERIERRNHFAFVEFGSLEDAVRARMEMDGAYIGCRQVCVEFSQKKPPLPSSESSAKAKGVSATPKAARLPSRSQELNERRPRLPTRSTSAAPSIRQRRRSYSPPLFPGQQARQAMRSGGRSGGMSSSGARDLAP